jgi:phosphatidylglycerophosphate synthase
MTTTSGIHLRQNLSLTAAAEKRLLVAIARLLPISITSDHLSALALLGMAAAGCSFAAMRFSKWGAAGVVLFLAVNWFGDSLDGTVARVRNQQRPRYGYYVDHVIDLAGIAFLMGGLACSGLMHPAIAAAVLAAYLLVSAETFLATHAAGVFRMSFLGFGPTELRIVLAIGTVRAIWSPWSTLVGNYTMQLFDVGGVITVIGLVSAFTVSALRNGRGLFIAEPLPANSRPDTARTVVEAQTHPVNVA